MKAVEFPGHEKRSTETAAGTYISPTNSFTSLSAMKCLAIVFILVYFVFCKGEEEDSGNFTAQLIFLEIFWNKLLNNQLTRI